MTTELLFHYPSPELAAYQKERSTLHMVDVLSTQCPNLHDRAFAISTLQAARFSPLLINELGPEAVRRALEEAPAQ